MFKTNQLVVHLGNVSTRIGKILHLYEKTASVLFESSDILERIELKELKPISNPEMVEDRFNSDNTIFEVQKIKMQFAELEDWEKIEIRQIYPNIKFTDVFENRITFKKL